MQIGMAAAQRTRTGRAKAGAGRERLIETAGALFAASGFDGVTTKQLAAQAGLSIGALYHHFPTKEAAYRTALEWGISRIPDPPAFSAHVGARDHIHAQIAWFCKVISGDGVESQLLRLELLDPHLDTPLSTLPPFSTSLARFQELMARHLPGQDADLVLAAVVSMSFGFARLGALRVQIPEFTARMRDPAEMARVVTRMVLGEEGRE